MKNAPKLAGLVFCGALALGFLSACSNQPQSADGRPFLNAEQIQKEYAESIKKLAWPKGDQPPAQLEGLETGVSYQQGIGDTYASTFFECAWEKEWLKTYNTNPQAAAEALKHLEKVPEMGFMQEPRADKQVVEVFKEMLRKARLGDPSGFQSDVRANCD